MHQTELEVRGRKNPLSLIHTKPLSDPGPTEQLSALEEVVVCLSVKLLYGLLIQR